MPLVRVEVRNEYGLGAPEMYRMANKGEPKEILEGVSVAGLVGVLRQLGDLADFAAEIFHGLQEEVMITSSRSHKLIGRIQRLEAELSPLEKSVLAQRSHLHFAYTNGSYWHSRIRCEKNHFIYSDVPQFIFDSYEDCRGPPCFYLLDRFDPGGPGSCLERYSDPTFFKRASGEASIEKVSKDKGNKEKRMPWPRSTEVYRGASFSYHGERMEFTQPMSTYDPSLRSDLTERSNSDLRNGSDYKKGDPNPSCSLQPKEQESRNFHLDDFAIGTENFKVAFNAIEPESETDVDLSRKQDIEIKNHILECQDSNVTSFTFRTNGGLLGLQPSKPVDFSLLNNLRKPEKTESLRKTGDLLPENTSSSRMFELSNKMLQITGSDKKVLHSGDVNDFKLKNHQKFGYQTFSGRTKDLFFDKSPVQSPSSPPPLVHMKISLQPIDGLETSKLKLKFPDGKTNNESSRDTFPSFQLVPEINIAKQNIGTDSDNKTFSRSSSPSLSDDQNSEHCETGEFPEVKDVNLYDSPSRISLIESIPTVMQNYHSRFSDLQKELRNDTNSEFATTPDPPPLPPVQWVSMKPNQDCKEDIFDLKMTISQEPKPAPLDHDQILEIRNEQKNKQFGTQKSNERIEANQGKRMDENEDFLHQIRAKSFSLRPTMPAKPTVPSGCSSNVQISVMLEKANAIRQAVGSDDGDEDGNWSDI